MTRPAYRFEPCRNPDGAHPGRNTYNHPCEVCGWQPEPKPQLESPKPERRLKAVPEPSQGVTMREIQTLQRSGTGVDMVEVPPGEEITGDGMGEALPECTLSTTINGVHMEGALGTPEGMAVAEAVVRDALGLRQEEEAPSEPRRPDYGVIDKNTGELQQLSLLGAQWEEYKVESLRLSLSGGDEFIKSMFDELVDGELSPGAIVEVVCRGIVKEHAPVFKKDGHEGKTVILLEVVRRITVLGHMTGKVEAAQNVDGEAKVLEEEDCLTDCEHTAEDCETCTLGEEFEEQPEAADE